MTQSSPIKFIRIPVAVVDGPGGPSPTCQNPIDIMQHVGIQFYLTTEGYDFGPVAIYPNDGELVEQDNGGDKQTLTLVDRYTRAGQWNITLELVHASGRTLRHDPEVINKPREEDF